MELIKYVLDKEGFRYEMITLRDGAEALAFIRKQSDYAREAQPQLIVMDLQLPKCHGIEILKEIKGSVELADVPVAVLSSSVSPVDKFRVARFRTTCFIPKPANLDEFLKVGKRIRQMATASRLRGAAE